MTRHPALFVDGRFILPECGGERATWLQAAGGRIAALGAGLGAGHGDVIDCGGRAVVPGFVDAHLHFFALADERLSVQVGPRAGVRSLEDLCGRLRDAAGEAPPGAWVRGKGYDETVLSEQRHPNRHDLDAACPRHPVKLTHRAHHAHVLNSLALAAVGIDRHTEDPPGGYIDRDLETGEPTGLLFEMGDLLAARMPRLAQEELDRAAAEASTELLASGITTFQDASRTNGSRRWEQLRRWKKAGILKQRVSVLLGWEGFLELADRGHDAYPATRGMGLGGLKIVLDRTTGSLYPSREELVSRIREADRLGWPVAVHTVEEETLEAALDAFDAAAKGRGSPRGRPRQRHRIEHASVCPPALIQRLAASGVTVVTQPSFLHYSGDRYLRMVPPDVVPHLYPIGALVAAGIRVAAASDAPIVPPRPLVGIAAAVTRRSEGGAVVGGEHGVSPEEALRMHTAAAARALGMERTVGSLATGKWADFVVLDRDPLMTPPDELSRIEPVMTVFGGEVVWRRDQTDEGRERAS